uniref:protein-tyrosine-phosphatase n=1 Tax=Paramormyrops kingsleyae TaxID=1676925 RepID=A0A3B3R9B6_9TELE
MQLHRPLEGPTGSCGRPRWSTVSPCFTSTSVFYFEHLPRSCAAYLRFTHTCMNACLRLSVAQCNDEVRSLRHYWYTSWPDQKTPDKAPPLLELVEKVEKARQQAPPDSGPIIVHCSAGIGRTGCFIATTILCKQLLNEGMVDILKTTCQLRLDRGGMIQTPEQYQFVHHVLSLYERQLFCSAEE